MDYDSPVSYDDQWVAFDGDISVGELASSDLEVTQQTTSTDSVTDGSDTEG